MKNEKNFTAALLAIYLCILTWVILFKLELNILDLIRTAPSRSINLIPLAGSAIINGHVDTSEIILNVIAFVPFGAYAAIIGLKCSFWQKLLPIFGISLLYEVLQYVLAIGVSDITDLIGNTLGGLIGICLFALLHYVIKDKAIRVVNIIACVGTVLIILLMGIVIFLSS